MRTSEICFVVPSYNEGKVLEESILPLLEFGQVLVVDDGSYLANSLSEPTLNHIHYLKHYINRGQGAAIETGFEYVRKSMPLIEYLVTFDADGQHVEMTMSPINTQHAEREYIFVFMTRDKWGTQSYSHNSSVAKGHVDYLRLIRTVGEAIMDFCVQFAPESIDISGGDADSTMKQKKNRIYANTCDTFIL